MTELYIHIGTHKTGSTSIQHALKGMSNINKEGWEYLHLPTKYRRLMYTDVHEQDSVTLFNKYLHKKVKKSSKTNRFILSAECLIGDPTNGYLNSNITSSMLYQATQAFNTKIIIYLRRQDDFIESMYTQKIHEGQSFTFDEFSAKFNVTGALDYNRIIEDYSRVFGKENIIIKSYHKAAALDLLHDFGSIIGSQSLAELNVQRKNQSYSQQAVALARVCNLELNHSEKKRLRKVLQRTLPKDKNHCFSYFSDQQRKDILSRFEHSNTTVAQSYFSQSTSNTLFPFPQDRLTSVEQSINLGNDKVAKLILELLSENKKTNKLVKNSKKLLNAPLQYFQQSFSTLR